MDRFIRVFVGDVVGFMFPPVAPVVPADRQDTEIEEIPCDQAEWASPAPPNVLLVIMDTLVLFGGLRAGAKPNEWIGGQASKPEVDC